MPVSANNPDAQLVNFLRRPRDGGGFMPALPVQRKTEQSLLTAEKALLAGEAVRFVVTAICETEEGTVIDVEYQP